MGSIVMNTLTNTIVITEHHPWYASDHATATIVSIIGFGICILMARIIKYASRFFSIIAMLFLVAVLGTFIARVGYEYNNPHTGTTALEVHKKFGLTQVTPTIINEERIIYRDNHKNLYTQCYTKIMKTEETVDDTNKYVKLYCSAINMGKKVEIEPANKN